MPQKSPIPAPTSTHRSGLKLRQTSMNDFAQILSKAGSYLGFAEAAGNDPAVQLEAIQIQRQQATGHSRLVSSCWYGFICSCASSFRGSTSIKRCSGRGPEEACERAPQGLL